MFKVLSLLLFLSTSILLHAQDSLEVSFSEEPDTLPKQRFLDRYENIFMTKVPTRHILKVGMTQYVEAVPYPLIDDKTLNKMTLHLGYEYKLFPSVSLALSGHFPLYGAGAPIKEQFQNTVVDAQLRWFFDMRKRIQSGKSANNFSGNYVALFYNIPGTARYDNQTGLKIGIQRRFLNHGYVDFAFAVSTSSYQLNLQSTKNLSFYTQASLGYAIGDWKKSALPPLCDILLCDEYENQLFKIRIPDLTISNKLTRFRAGFAFEQRIFKSSWTLNIQLDGATNNGTNTLRYDHREFLGIKGQQAIYGNVPYALVKSREKVGILTLQPRYYFLEKRQRLMGKSSNGLSGCYAGINSEINYYKGEHSFKYLQQEDLKIESRSLQLGPLLGIQLRLFQHGYLDLNASYNFKRDLNDHGHSFAPGANIGIGVIL